MWINRSSELNVFGAEELASANMNIRDLEVKQRFSFSIQLAIGLFLMHLRSLRTNVDLNRSFLLSLQSSTSALSDMIDPSERKVLEFPTVSEEKKINFLLSIMQCYRLVLVECIPIGYQNKSDNTSQSGRSKYIRTTHWEVEVKTSELQEARENTSD